MPLCHPLRVEAKQSIFLSVRFGSIATQTPISMWNSLILTSAPPPKASGLDFIFSVMNTLAPETDFWDEQAIGDQRDLPVPLFNAFGFHQRYPLEPIISVLSLTKVII